MITLNERKINSYKEEYDSIKEEMEQDLLNVLDIQEFDFNGISQIEDFFENLIIETNYDLFKLVALSELLGNSSDISNTIENLFEHLDEDFDEKRKLNCIAYQLKTGMGSTWLERIKDKDKLLQEKNLNRNTVQDVFDYLIERQEHYNTFYESLQRINRNNLTNN